MLKLVIIPKWLEAKLASGEIVAELLSDPEYLKKNLSSMDHDIFIYIQNNKNLYIDANILAYFDLGDNDAVGKPSITVDLFKKNMSETESKQQLLGMDNMWDTVSFKAVDKGTNSVFVYPTIISTLYDDIVDIYGSRFDIPELVKMSFFPKWLMETNSTHLL